MKRRDFLKGTVAVGAAAGLMGPALRAFSEDSPRWGHQASTGTDPGE